MNIEMTTSCKVLIFFILKVDCFSGAWKFHATKKGDKSNPLLTKRKGTTDRAHHQTLE